jgi:hypothetical protein
MDRKITFRLFTFYFFLWTTSVFGQKWVDTVVIKPPTNQPPIPPKPPKKKLENIEEIETKYSVIMTLRNYEPGEIEHVSKDIFIQRVKVKIQELRVDKKIKKIIVVGWADGTINKGISQSKFKVTNECIHIFTNDRIYDLELAKLRGCDIHRRLSSFMYSNSIQLSELIDGYDEKDNINADGAFRKVVITIEF